MPPLSGHTHLASGISLKFSLVNTLPKASLNSSLIPSLVSTRFPPLSLRGPSFLVACDLIRYIHLRYRSNTLRTYEYEQYPTSIAPTSYGSHRVLKIKWILEVFEQTTKLADGRASLSTLTTDAMLPMHVLSKDDDAMPRCKKMQCLNEAIIMKGS